MLFQEKFNLKVDISGAGKDHHAVLAIRVRLLLLPFQHSHIYLARGQHRAHTMLKVYWDPQATHNPALSPQLPTGELRFKTWLNDENLLLRKVSIFYNKIFQMDWLLIKLDLPTPPQ